MNSLIKNKLGFINLVLIATLMLLLKSSALEAKEYNRIVSLAPSVTESLRLLGLNDQIIAVTIYCPNPTKIETIGSILKPNIEKVVYIKPDLVIACKEANNRSTIDKLMRLGMNVFIVDESADFSEICDNFIALAETVDRKDQAKKIIEAARQNLMLISRRVINLRKPRVFWELGARPLITVNSQSFIDDIISYAEGINIFGDLELIYPRISIEEVIRRNPDVIILTAMGDVSYSEITRWKKYEDISAVKNNRIHIFDSDLACWPIPTNFVKSVELLSGLLYPASVKDE